MSTIVLPTRVDVPHYTFEIELERRTFGFEFLWNDRSKSWSFNLFRDGLYDDAHLLLAGRKIVIDLPLLARYRDPRLPAGELCAIDTSGQAQNPGLDELGDRVRLLYFDFADIPAGWKA